ncbi:hypothetical protein PFICI_13890 [Pestalotiopsis fici W106-1]|uniref:Methyltransferase n=1 Tax=Pestalotiopsis fici (strain W106-1 / CGMCC3.15140) TaxID=1229662 RepID=W3WJS6_PESFW|nr:uncharacterized protein PFICI_13890 [Pestalotiopsis fici W106-1]ETS74024.1 hypothetical protein PFICI_13890 [Pestalotiopsis fici W106-1]
MVSKFVQPCGDVTTQLNFYSAPTDGQKPFDYVDSPPPGQPQRNYSDDPNEVVIRDIRGRENDFTLDRDAFQILQSLGPFPRIQITEEAIKEIYYPEIEKLLLSTVPGSHQVIIFDHTYRKADPAAHRTPVQKAHIDQTAASVEKRIRMYLPDEADQLLQRRYRLINVWRPLNKMPVESFPLAFASTSSLEDHDFVPVRHHHQDGYIGETASIKYNPGQNWYYLSGMTDSECVLLECFDSESLKADSTIGGRVPHTAFPDPRTRPGAVPRESIEVRTLVFGP